MATVDKDFRIKHGLVVEGATATVNGNNVITDGDTTDVLDEGTANLYYTDQRVKDVLTGSTQTNISITEVDGDLVITAENGVDDATTDDLDEGTTNKYFTDTRVYEKVDTIITAGTGITVTPDAMAETITIDVDTDTIATKQYVDAATAGLNVHDSVKAATVANINIATDLENGDLLDGVTLDTTNRVLVKNQTTKSQNGVYIVQASGAALRAPDYDEAGEVDAGDFIFVEGGTINGKTGWVQTNVITTIGSDNIEFTQFSGVGTYVGGTGIDINAEEISIDFTEFDSDDVTEGTTNLYYTDQKVKDVLTGSTQTNISITEVDGDLVITAENGVDDATTDDLDEGTTNLYFTDQRAIDALDGANVSVASVNFSDVATNVAFSTLVESTSVPEAVATFDKTAYRSAKYLVKMSTATHTQLSEILVTLDSSDNVAITEYGIVGTNGSMGDLTADISGNDVRLIADVNNANTTVKVFGTLVE